MREDVQQQLTLLGVDPDEAAERVAGLSDEEIQQIVGQLDELPAGEGGLGVVVGAILTQNTAWTNVDTAAENSGSSGKKMPA